MLRQTAVPFIALSVCATVAWLAQPTTVSGAEQSDLANRYHFTAYPLSAPNPPWGMRLRTVAPAYKGVAALLSGFGASVALFAADSGTVSHDVCLVDPRSNSVTVEPAPTTGERYAPFTLAPAGGPGYAAPMGCMPADLNEDGWQDLVVYYWGRSPVVFLRVPGVPPSKSAFVPHELVAPSQVWNTSTATVGDFEGNGHVDLVFGNYYPDGARILDPSAHGTTLQMPDSFANADNGGSMRYFRFESASAPSALGVPDVRYSEVPGVFAGDLAHRWHLAVGAQDLTGEGLPDLYAANDFGPDALLINESTPGHVRFREARGVRSLTTPKSMALGNSSFKGMGVAFADLDGGDIPTILVSNTTESYGAMENNFAFTSNVGVDRFRRDAHRGVADYEDRSEPLGLARSGWTWDVATADFDASGDPVVLFATGFGAGHVNRWPQMQEANMASDVFLRYPGAWPRIVQGADLSGHDGDRFMVRSRSGRYVDVAALVGVQGQVPSRGIAVGDVTGDGKLDYLVANQGGPSVLWHNESRAGSFLGLRLRMPAVGAGACDVNPGSSATRPAIGASARITVAGGTHRSAQVYPATGHAGFSAPDLYFGLGAKPLGATPTDLAWRDGCGYLHHATTNLQPGWHNLLLAPDGTVSDMT